MNFSPLTIERYLCGHSPPLTFRFVELIAASEKHWQDFPNVNIIRLTSEGTFLGGEGPENT